MNKKLSIKDKVYNAILEDILSYEYKPNQILNEKNLVEKYGVSKTPVREALLSLCDDKVLRSMPRYGYEVIRFTTEDVYNMLQYRFVLESGLIRSNMDRITQVQIEKLEEIDRLCSEAIDDVWEHWSLNIEFHIELINSCNNKYATQELEKTMARLTRAYAQFYWDNPESKHRMMDTRNHVEIIEGLKDKNEKLLFKALLDDISDFGGIRSDIIKEIIGYKDFALE